MEIDIIISEQSHGLPIRERSQCLVGIKHRSIRCSRFTYIALDLAGRALHEAVTRLLPFLSDFVQVGCLIIVRMRYEQQHDGLYQIIRSINLNNNDNIIILIIIESSVQLAKGIKKHTALIATVHHKAWIATRGRST